MKYQKILFNILLIFTHISDIIDIILLIHIKDNSDCYIHIYENYCK